jgi:hypothetical protein
MTGISEATNVMVYIVGQITSASFHLSSIFFGWDPIAYLARDGQARISLMRRALRMSLASLAGVVGRLPWELAPLRSGGRSRRTADHEMRLQRRIIRNGPTTYRLPKRIECSRGYFAPRMPDRA